MRSKSAAAQALFGVLLVGVVAGVAAVAPAPTKAAGPNRAAVVADTGSTVRTACVEFTSESVAGIEALQLAGFAPAVYGFGSMGGAVCSMCGKGCPANSTCLTCDAPNYWAYHRATAGTSKFTFSGTGAGSTTVRNGDVEGWRYGTGAAPAFVSFGTICGSASVPASSGDDPPAEQGTSGATSGQNSDGGGAQASGSSGSGSGTAGSTEPSGSDPSAATGDGSSPGTAASDGTGDADDADVSDVARASAQGGSGSGRGGGTFRSLALFGAVVAAIMTAIVIVRIRKRRLRGAQDASG